MASLALGLKWMGAEAYKEVYSIPGVPFVIKLYDCEEDVGYDSANPHLTPFEDRVVKFVYKDVMLAIQPKVCETDRAVNIAYKRLVRKYGRNTLEEYDVHKYNVGLVGNKAMIFDYWVE